MTKRAIIWCCSEAEENLHYGTGHIFTIFPELPGIMRAKEIEISERSYFIEADWIQFNFCPWCGKDFKELFGKKWLEEVK